MSTWHDEVVSEYGPRVETYDHAATRQRIEELRAEESGIWRAKWFTACERVFGTNVPPDHRTDDMVFIRVLTTGRSHTVRGTYVPHEFAGDELRVETGCGRFLSEGEFVPVDAAETPMCELCARRLARSLVDA